MYYFVPAWYPQNERPWYYQDIEWYYKNPIQEFDDTVHQIRLFTKENEPCQLVILNYEPSLRDKLFRLQLFSVDRFVLFDQLQGISRHHTQPLSIENLNWPKGCTFIYNPFTVIVMKDQAMYARIELTASGRIGWIFEIENEQIVRRLIFDDRGFLSSIAEYQHEQINVHHYFNESGVLQFSEYFDERGIIISEGATYDFSQAHYASMTELVQTESKRFFEKMTPQDIVVLAASPIHQSFIAKYSQNATLVLSYFAQRYQSLETIIVPNVSNLKLVITDSPQISSQIKEQLPINVVELSPFDTRLALGKSQRVKEMIIHLVISNTSFAYFVKLAPELAQLLEKNPLLHFVLAGNNPDLITTVSDAINTHSKQVTFNDADELLPLQLEKEQPASRVTTFLYHEEEALIKQLEYTRLIVDLSDTPDLYTQIAGISAGIPQINCVHTQYVIDEKNGRILHNIDDTITAIHYYTDTLSHWNRSLVHSVQLIEQYASAPLVAQWKNYLVGE